MKVHIVSKTYLGDGYCVGGLGEANESLRLLPAHGSKQPSDTEFDVGDVWDLELRRVKNVVPPHVEDVRVLGEEYLGEQDDLAAHLLSRITPWTGSPVGLYNGSAQKVSRYAVAVEEDDVPDRSTWFWVPDKPLKWKEWTDDWGEHSKYSYELGPFSEVRMSYRGTEKPRDLPAGTLVRVSLARWHPPNDPDRPPRCYLQVSGWY